MTISQYIPTRKEHLKQVVSILILIATITLCSALRVHADEATQKAPAKGEKVKAAAKAVKPAQPQAVAKSPETAKKVAVTGSRIPREVKGSGNIRATTSPVYIIDREEIERSGAMTTTALLRRLPFVP